MRKPYLNPLSAYAGLLSAFDLSGCLLLGKSIVLSKDLEEDLNQLTNDQIKLEGDYKNACDRIAKEEGMPW